MPVRSRGRPECRRRRTRQRAHGVHDRPFKTETIKPGGLWRTLDDVEPATLTWVNWYNNRCLHSSIGDLPPTGYETVHYRSPQTATAA
ncbi:integrase core domain-containing protein [Streptomyces sp. C10-9-1]|uniref:integrase core domain-containing protein n=1 Tax=Streptomyces sp. C10-9-1 TaxID=1859285 RepID=UPI0035AB7CB8